MLNRPFHAELPQEAEAHLRKHGEHLHRVQTTTQNIILAAAFLSAAVGQAGYKPYAEHGPKSISSDYHTVFNWIRSLCLFAFMACLASIVTAVLVQIQIQMHNLYKPPLFWLSVTCFGTAVVMSIGAMMAAATSFLSKVLGFAIVAFCIISMVVVLTSILICKSASPGERGNDN